MKEKFKCSQAGVKCPLCKVGTQRAEDGSHFRFEHHALQNVARWVARAGSPVGPGQCPQGTGRGLLLPSQEVRGSTGSLGVSAV